MKSILSTLRLSFCLIIVFAACQPASPFDEKLLVGSWEVKEWKIEKTGKLVKNKMDMSYQADSTYIIDYGPKSESGKYWLAGDLLHTEETDRAEKTVKIIKLTAEHMEMKMNRGGQMEHVILAKKK